MPCVPGASTVDHSLSDGLADGVGVISINISSSRGPFRRSNSPRQIFFLLADAGVTLAQLAPPMVLPLFRDSIFINTLHSDFCAAVTTHHKTTEA